MENEREGPLQRLFTYNILLFVCVILALALMFYVYFTGSEIERINQHYISYIDNNCICSGHNIVPNFPLIVSDEGVFPGHNGT